MTALYITGFVLFVIAVIALLGLTPEQVNNDVSLFFDKQETLKDKALTARGKKKKSKILSEIERMRRALQETGKEKQFSLACTAAMLLMIAGFIVSIAIDNMFLIPVLAVAFALIPFAYLAKTISIYETQVREEIETALSIITTSYVRSDNLISAVRENITYLKPPVKGIFESFLVEGNQSHNEVFGKSITDPCLGWEDTERLLLDIAGQV